MIGTLKMGYHNGNLLLSPFLEYNGHKKMQCDVYKCRQEVGCNIGKK